jgi:hypothetical protein
LTAPFLTEIWQGVVSGPGLYLGVPAARYHLDPCPEPSLSASVAKIAFNRSLKHAKAAHPRLRDPDFPEDDDTEERSRPWYMEVGSACHTLVLGRGEEPVEIKVPNFRKKDAQEQRDLARAQGKIPLITKHYDIAHRMAAVARPVVENLLGAEFLAESMVCSEEKGMWRRSLLDAASFDLRNICDLKTTSLEMSPQQAARTVNRANNAFQAAYYIRNADNIDPSGMGRRRFLFAYIETEYPYEMSVVYPDEALMTKADAEVNAACIIWDRAMRTGVWPGYSREPFPIAPENWMMRQFEDRMLMDDTLKEDEHG